MAVVPVPRYLAETARRDHGVAGWIPELSALVAGLAAQWSLDVGVPFQPGGQCSWTAPVTGPGVADLVLKVAFRFSGGEERDEAAGLRVWDGNGTVRLHAACQTESAYACCSSDACPAPHSARCCPAQSRTWWWPGCWAGCGRSRPAPTLMRQVATRLAPA